jgi:hypothetical protein
VFGLIFPNNRGCLNFMKDSNAFEQILNYSSLEVGEIAQELRKFIGEVFPDVIETVWEKQGIAGYGIGPKKMSEQFCYIAPLKNYVNFGFYYGASLDDPYGLLEGTGKNLRHVKIRQKSDVANPSLRKLLEQASRYLPKL